MGMRCDREDVPRRLRRLDGAAVLGMRVFVARRFRARLLGLAGLREVPADCLLLIPGCRSVHTVGMRFAIDVTFVDRHGRELRTVRGVRPWRVVGCRDAAAAIERPAGQSDGGGPDAAGMWPKSARRGGGAGSGGGADEVGEAEAEGLEGEVLGDVELEREAGVLAALGGGAEADRVEAGVAGER